jgi:seryl-tRNA synthetase
VIPNTPREDVPEGKDEHGNVEQRKVGYAAEAGWRQQAACSTFEIASAWADGLRDGGQAVRSRGSWC